MDTAGDAPPPTRRFSTGAQFLDFRLDGGLPAGRLLVLLAPPATQSELLLHSMASTRPTHVISTITPDAWEFESGLATTGQSTDLEYGHVPAPALRADPAQHLTVSPESFVIVDADTALEADREDYLGFLNTLRARLRETESVGVLHLPDTDTPDLRSLTLKRADQVWRLEQRVESREIKTRLLVTKARGTRALTEPVPLVLTDRVRVDTSRRIS